jgi:hypothetical protein
MAARLCAKHDARRRAIKSADQRRVRHGTTAPRVEFPPREAHWLYDAWDETFKAAADVRARPRDGQRLKALLDSLVALQDELGPALKPVADAFELRPWRKPDKDWTPPRRTR